MTVHDILGPRVPAEELAAHRARYLAPTLAFVSAAALLVVSIFMPYWRLRLNAPQYPKGLYVRAYLNRLEGDVREIDGLNHYIGMRSLGEAATLERSLSILGVTALVFLLLAAVFVHTRWAALLALPALAFPLLFLVDLQFWLANYGQNLDPKAPLSSSVQPFIPPALGEGKVGQFSMVSSPEAGLWLATAAAILVAVGLWCHRRAYKPLVEAMATRGEPGHGQASS